MDGGTAGDVERDAATAALLTPRAVWAAPSMAAIAELVQGAAAGAQAREGGLGEVEIRGLSKALDRMVELARGEDTAQDTARLAPASDAPRGEREARLTPADRQAAGVVVRAALAHLSSCDAWALVSLARAANCFGGLGADDLQRWQAALGPYAGQLKAQGAANALLCWGKLARAAQEQGEQAFIDAAVLTDVVERACQLARQGCQLGGRHAANALFGLAQLGWPAGRAQLEALLAGLLVGLEDCEPLNLSQAVLAWGLWEERMPPEWDPQAPGPTPEQQRALGTRPLAALPPLACSAYPGPEAVRRLEGRMLALRRQASPQALVNMLHGLACLKHMPRPEFLGAVFAGGKSALGHGLVEGQCSLLAGVGWEQGVWGWPAPCQRAGRGVACNPGSSPGWCSSSPWPGLPQSCCADTATNSPLCRPDLPCHAPPALPAAALPPSGRLPDRATNSLLWSLARLGVAPPAGLTQRMVGQASASPHGFTAINAAWSLATLQARPGGGDSLCVRVRGWSAGGQAVLCCVLCAVWLAVPWA